MISRFDLVFLLLDSKDEAWDRMVTSYILQGRDISEMAKLAQPPPPTEEDEGPTQVWSVDVTLISKVVIVLDVLSVRLVW